MTDKEANVGLIKHVNKHIDNFLDEYDPAKFENLAELAQAFSRYLRIKERGHEHIKRGPGIIALHTDQDIGDDESTTICRIQLFSSGEVGVMWVSQLFTNPALPLPDEIRESLIHALRLHADRLEDRSMDRRMREIAPDETGAA